MDDVFADIEDKLDEMGVSVIEERYDLLHHRYEIYVKVNLRQSYKLRKFIKFHGMDILYLETLSH